MKQSLVCVGLLSLSIACNSSNDPASSPGSQAGATGSSAGSAGTAAGSGGSAAGGPNGGSSFGGNPAAGSGNGGAALGGAGNGAGSGGSAGSAGSAGGSGMTGTAFKCSPGPFDALDLAGKTATRVPGAPPSDAFNNQTRDYTNVEGPVWIGDSLYFSEMTGANLPPARILKLAPGNVVSVAVADSGSNGLAVDANGDLLAAVHKDGSISRVALPSGMETPLASLFGQPPMRFNSPNDLAIRSDGTIYFSDPNYQNNATPQGAQRLYRIAPPPTRAVSIATNPSDTAYIQPNGVTLSPDEKTLYITSMSVKKYSVMADGTLSAGTDFGSGVNGGDGMVVDCAGNLYIAGGGSSVKVLSPTGTTLGTVMAAGTTTNVAFGGTDHKTLYITAQGSNGVQGVFSVALNVPGYPY